MAEQAGPVLVPSIYIGGGTPSLLPVELIGELLTAARTAFEVDGLAEISIEVNPTLDRPQMAEAGLYFEQLRALGVNRLSLGVQSSHDDELRLLRRGHSFQEAGNTVEAARQAGFDNLNVDLIYGLPGQPIEKWQATLKRVIEWRPDHISAYSLQVEERTAILRWVQTGVVSEPDEDDVAAMYEWAEDALDQAGFAHYEISNWASRKLQTNGLGFCSRHNLVYWRNDAYFGFGCGAHSSYDGRRYSNVLHPREYIARIGQGGNAIVEAEEIDRPLEMGETMMLGLRLIEEGVSRAHFADRFGLQLDEIYGAALTQLTAQGLLESDEVRVRLTPQGRLLGNRVFGEFLPAVP